MLLYCVTQDRGHLQLLYEGAAAVREQHHRVHPLQAPQRVDGGAHQSEVSTGSSDSGPNQSQLTCRCRPRCR